MKAPKWPAEQLNWLRGHDHHGKLFLKQHVYWCFGHLSRAPPWLPRGGRWQWEGRRTYCVRCSAIKQCFPQLNAESFSNPLWGVEVCRLQSPWALLDCYTGIVLPVCTPLASVISPHWETQHHAVHLFQCKNETKWVPSLYCRCCPSLAYKLQQRSSIFFWADDFLEMAAQLCSHASTAAF